MTVTAALFFLCAVAAALVYRWLPAKFRNYWLLAVSLGFLATWSWKFILVLGALTLVNYLLGFKAAPANSHARRWVTAGIVLNVLALFIFKYSAFYLPEATRLLNSLGIGASDGLQILLPIGLSFLVVQWISYLLDVTNGRLDPQRNFVRFSLYAFYFPRLISGPVERARAFFERLESPLAMDRALLERSLVLIFTGLFRKLVFANPLFAMIPADAFTSPASYDGQHLVVWLLAYAFAIYNDFAGYTMIVRGVSLWFGIELTNNFNLPYLSRNFSEFWNRWHISLSNWLRDYIFYPLSWSLLKRNRSQKAFINFVLPPLVTMAVSGMWHGLSWNMLLWGGLHGLYLIVERVPALFKPQPPVNERPRWRQWLGRGITFLFAVLAWVPFKTSEANSLLFWKGLALWQKPDFFLFKSVLLGDRQFLDWSSFGLPNPILCLLLAAALAFDLLQHRDGSETFIQRWPRWAQIVLVVVLLLAALLAAFTHQAAPFVYQTF
jgi:alginate O-acetyltransferase complex protein AlgI